MSAPEEPMEQRPDLAARLRYAVEFVHAARCIIDPEHNGEMGGYLTLVTLDAQDVEEMRPLLEEAMATMRAAADIVEAHQRLLDAIGDPEELRQWIEEFNSIKLRQIATRIAEAVDGAS